MDEIEVKLTPLDEDSKAALTAFANEIKAVRNSMKEIKEAFQTELSQFRNTLDNIKNAGMSQGQGGGQFPALTAAGFEIPGRSQTAPGARSTTASTPPDATFLGPDQAGHGGAGGGGGTGDPSAGFPYPSGSGSASGGVSPGASLGDGRQPDLSHSNWYSGDLQIPRINEFNIQDYTRMAGKVIGGPALGRYKENQAARQQAYDDAYASAKDAGKSNPAARAAAEAAANSLSSDPMREGDITRINTANRLAQLGQIGPFAAAVQGLSPNFLSPGGLLKAPALAAQFNAGMGLQGTFSDFATQVPAAGLAFLGGAAGSAGVSLPGLVPGTMMPVPGMSLDLPGGRLGLGNEAAYRFGAMTTMGRNLNPNAPGLFSFEDRSKFAEASMQVGMTGYEFDNAAKVYTEGRQNSRPVGAFEIGQFAELEREMVRQSGTPYKKATDELENLANSAQYAGMTVKQMGDAAQAYHAANPQTTMTKSVQQTAAFAMAGVNGDIANQLVNNPYMQGAAMQAYGVTPDQVAGMSPAATMRLAGQTYDSLYNQFRGVTTRAPGQTTREAIETRMATATGLSAETLKQMRYGEGLAAATEAQDNMDDPRKLRRNLEEMVLPNMGGRGGYGGLSPQQIQDIMNAGRGKGKKAAAEARQKAFERTIEGPDGRGFDINLVQKALEDAGGDPKAILKTTLDDIKKKDPEAYKALKEMGAMGKLPDVIVGFSGLAENWLKQMGVPGLSGDATSSTKKPNNSNPSHGSHGNLQGGKYG